MDPTLLHLSLTEQQIATFLYHAIVIYIPEENILLKCQIYATCVNYFICINWGYINTHPTYEVTSINHVTRSAIYRQYQTMLTLYTDAG